MTELTATQERVFEDRYQYNGETIEGMWDRVAKWVASNERDDKRWYERFRWLVDDFKFLPGGRIHHAAGRPGEVTALNCFVIPSPNDSIEGIYHSLMLWAKTMARGGGVGINMSSLRPRESLVLGSHGTSSGPVPFMELFTTTSKEVIQQGGTRRGAAMIVLEDWHPDIYEFIDAKTQWGKLEGANISVGISNKFMEAVEKDRPWNMVWKGEQVKTVGANYMWDKIAEAAWKSGEPGILFLDRCNDWSNLWYLPEQRIQCVNPCSEIPLPAYGCCLLGTFNLERFVKTHEVTGDKFPYFDWHEFQSVIEVAVRFLDNVIDTSYYPLQEYRDHQKAVRQMGLGVTGLADALIKLGIRYGDGESISFVEDIFEQIANVAYATSAQLAKEKGACEVYDERFLEGEYVQRLPTDIRESIAKYGIRNSYLVGQQPSGTGSLLAGVNSGIEPVFSYNTERTDRTGVWSPETVGTRIYNERVREQKEQDSVFVSAHQLSPFDHINIQAAAQRWCDQSISKTVNCPEIWSVGDVKKVYQYAWDKGLKSVAVYRDKSRPEQVLSVKEPEFNSFDESEAMTTDSVPSAGCRSGVCEV